MSKSVNRITLVGHVGQDPEVRSTQNGGRVATLSLATSDRWLNGRNEWQERTAWHRLVVWNRGQKGGLADVVEKYVKKGDKLYVEGKVEYREWTDKENAKRTTTEINVSEVVLLSGKSESSRDTTDHVDSDLGF